MSRELDIIKKLYARLLNVRPTPFPLAGERLDVTPKHGVYIIFSPRSRVLHVGRTLLGKKGLRQ